MADTWLGDPAAPFNSDIRSPLIARIVWLCFSGTRAVAGHDPVTLVHVAYLVLGLFNVLAIPAVYRLTEQRLGARAATQAAWLMSAEALLPRIATRALISVIAMVPLAWGTFFADRASRAPLRDGAIAGALLGVGALVRFQVGLVCIAVAALLFVRDRRRFFGLVVGGGLAALAQWCIDRGTSVAGYLAFNGGGGSERYGTAPWFTYVLDLALLTLPVTPWIARPLWQAARRHTMVSIPFAVFVVAHSLVPHKEEHFIFAVLPYFFVLLGAALAETRAKRAYWIVNALAVAVVTVSDGHRSLTGPLIEARRDGSVQRVYFVGRLLTPDFYLGHEIELRRVRNAGELVDGLAGETAMKVRVIFEDPPEADAITAVERAGFGCTPPTTSHGDVVDRVLVAVNRRNQRRAEKIVIDCWR